MFVPLNFLFLIGSKDYQTGVDFGWLQIENHSVLPQEGQIDLRFHDYRWAKKKLQ